MEIRQIIAHFFSGDEATLSEDLKELKKEYIKEIHSGRCSGCQAARVRAKYESLIIKKMNDG